MNKYSLIIILILHLFITACSIQEKTQQKVHEIVEPVVDTIKEVDERVKQIQSGATMIRRGVDLIKGNP